VKAVLLKQNNGNVTPELSSIETPSLKPGSVRVAVRAASVNRADLLIRAGTHAPAATGADAPPVAGLDTCGEVIEVAPDVTGVNKGDRIMAIVSGGLAEEVIVPAGAAVPVPSAWSFEEGAAAITALMTEHNALATAARLQPGETVLVHAAASGVATQAIQLARLLGAGSVFGTSRSQANASQLRDLGLDELIDTSSTNFAERILELTNGKGIDVILDHVGGPYLEDNIRAASVKCRIVGVGRLGGATGTLDMEELARKRVELIGVTFRTRSDQEKFAIAQALQDIDLETNAEALRPLIRHTYAWEQVLEAQEELAKNTHVGKLVLSVR
jgi:NADPH:quinone reductase-like Zn-dependent oxidoreductase